MSSLIYSLSLTPDTNGTLLVTCPDLPEVTTFGEDEADALLRARDAIEEALAGRMADREEIPEPAVAGDNPTIDLPPQTTLKVLLYRTTRRPEIERPRKAVTGRSRRGKDI